MTDSLIESRQVNKQSSPFPASSFSNFKLQGPPDTDIQAGSALDSSVPRSFGGKPFQPLLNQVIPGLTGCVSTPGPKKGTSKPSKDGKVQTKLTFK